MSVSSTVEGIPPQRLPTASADAGSAAVLVPAPQALASEPPNSGDTFAAPLAAPVRNGAETLLSQARSSTPAGGTKRAAGGAAPAEQGCMAKRQRRDVATATAGAEISPAVSAAVLQRVLQDGLCHRLVAVMCTWRTASACGKAAAHHMYEQQDLIKYGVHIQAVSKHCTDLFWCLSC